jgi:hypothetical protein
MLQWWLMVEGNSDISYLLLEFLHGSPKNLGKKYPTKKCLVG